MNRRGAPAGSALRDTQPTARVRCVCCVPCASSIAWPGGDLVTNKLDALERFIARVGGEDKLTPAQRVLVQRARGSHLALPLTVRVVSSEELKSQSTCSTEGVASVSASAGRPSLKRVVREGSDGPVALAKRLACAPAVPCQDSQRSLS